MYFATTLKEPKDNWYIGENINENRRDENDNI